MSNSWNNKSLGQLIDLEYGASLRDDARSGEGMPVYGSNGVVGYHDKSLMDGPGIIVGRKGSVGKVIWSDSNFWPIDTAYFVNTKGDTNIKWIYYLLRSLQLSRLDSSTGVPGLNRNDVYQLAIQEPPEPEQSKIAEVLSTCDEAIEQTEAIIAKYKRIKQGLMQDLLTKGIDEDGNIRSEKTHKFKNSPLGRIPVEWDAGHVNQCADTLYGLPFESDQFIDEGDGTRLLRGLNVSRGFIRWNKDKTVLWPSMSKKLSRYLLEENDLVIGMDGALIGYNFASVTAEDLPCLLVQRVARLRAKSEMNPTLLKMYFASPRFAQYVNTVKTHTAIPHISGEDIETFRVPLPHPEEQKLIGRSFSACEEALEAEMRTLKKQVAIKRGLMQDLLSGNVRVTSLMQKV